MRRVMRSYAFRHMLARFAHKHWLLSRACHSYSHTPKTILSCCAPRVARPPHENHMLEHRLPSRPAFTPGERKSITHRYATLPA